MFFSKPFHDDFEFAGHGANYTADQILYQIKWCDLSVNQQAHGFKRCRDLHRSIHVFISHFAKLFECRAFWDGLNERDSTGEDRIVKRLCQVAGH